ncbi:MAG TPA: 50S ribosomal protein L9 [Candidatus Paceibacterota bacterium]|nr:50S ribosomal protein L9 [Candidatus Paceibacterota bacterium]
MKVVLLKDVKDTGRAGAVVECSDGHALNFLFPRKLAAAATPANLKQAEIRAQQDKDRKELDEKLIEGRVTQLATEKLTFTKKANEKGHLYDAVDAKEIAEKAQLPEEAVRLERPIKELGTFSIPVSHGKDFGSFDIEVVAE